MFATSYSNSPLVGAAANEIFPNIKDDSQLGDVTILATMRALLYDRLPDGQKAALVTREVASSNLTGELNANLISAFPGYDLATAENTLFIMNVPASSDEEKKTLLFPFAGVKDLFGMKPAPAVEKGLFDKVMKSKIYMDAERSCTLIFVAGNMTSVTSHAIAILVARYFDRFFEHDAKGHVVFTPDETLLVIEGLSKSDRPDTFIGAIQKFSERFDFRTPEIKTKLDGFERNYAKGRVNSLDRNIENTTNEINEVNRQYASLVRKKRSLIDQRVAAVLGLEAEKNDNTLMNYFLANTNLSLAQVSDNQVQFYAKTPLANFDSDRVGEYLARKDRAERVDMYTRGPNRVKPADRDLLFKAIFIDQTVRVWLFGYFVLSYGELIDISAESSFTQPPEMHDCCPNPHLYKHSCMGDNRRYAQEALLNGDFIGAMEQAIGSVASVNVSEGVTVGPWMDYLLKDEYGRFFETAEGERKNFTEIMKYLKKEEK